MSYQNSVIYRAQSCSSQCSPSSLGNQRKSVKSVFTELTRSPQVTQFLPSSLGHRSKWLCSPSSLGHQRKLVKSVGKVSFHWAHSVTKGKVGEISFHRAHSVLTGNSVLTEFTRRLKDFTGSSVLTEHCRLTQDFTEFSVLTELSRLTQELFFEQSLPSWVGQ